MNNIRYFFVFIICFFFTKSIIAQIEPIDSPYYPDGPYTVIADSVLNLPSPFLIYRPDNADDGPYPLFIFHVGANEAGTNFINWHSYDLFLKHLSSYGYIVAVLEQIPGPPNGPYFSNTIDYISEEVANGTNWMSTQVDTTKMAVGGHSFGGVAASQIISDQPDRVDAIVYFASFPFLVPGIGQDVTAFSGNMLSIGGAEDMDSDSLEVITGYNGYENTSCKAWYYIDGLGHAGFGDYTHPTQTIGTIGRTNATATIRHLLVSFMENEFKNTDLGMEQFLNAGNYPNTIINFYNTCTTNTSVGDRAETLKATIYPNPTSSSIYLEIDNVNVLVDIFNSSGQKVYSEIHNQGEEIDLSGLETCIYMVRLNKGNAFKNFKIIKY